VAAVQKISDWLDKLGMSEYAQRFAENRIDVSVLRDLTDQDLKDLGIVLGDRRKILRAISELDEGLGTAGRAIGPAPLGSAERRHVTVLFSDLVGSTALSTRLDPEDLREVIAAYQNCVAGTVRRLGGFVARYLGDGVLAYFGWPQAHEDDAERSVCAGLELVAAVAGIKAHAALQTRVGIATGLVVVGDLAETGEGRERGIVGETPNLAARLQTLAEPNTVVIAEGTRKLLGHLFELEDLGARELKGIPGLTRAWAVLRARTVESRFEALRAAHLTELVGRDEEREWLRRRWARAGTGDGQVVLLSGEAGIGKSRLTAALLDDVAAEPHTRLRYFCSPQHTDSPLHPVIGQLERAAGLAHDDSPRARLDKLDALLEQTSTSIDARALLAEMLSLPNDGRYPAADLAPPERRQRTLDALLSGWEAVSQPHPLVMIFEDAHWADPTSLELFSHAVDRIRTRPVLLIVTFRPEFAPPWIGRPHVTALTLNRLAKRDIGTMVDRLVGTTLIPASLRQDIIERTDGIPLFIEEMTQAVAEAEGPRAAERTIATIPSPARAVPASLQASLMARLDRLGAAKEVAQIGAAIGREFSHALLAAVVRNPEAELTSALDRLMGAGLLFRQGVPPHATYLFKHALVQDAAYGTLLRERRRALHARIAETLEGQFPEIAESQPELLARHCSEAGLIEKAAGLWGKAGQRSLARLALVEALEQLKRALAQIATLPATSALRREEIKLQVALISPLLHVRGFAAPETKAAAERARRLIEQAEALGEPPEDPLLLVAALHGLWSANFVAFNGGVLRELAAQILVRGEKQGARIPLMIGHRVTGQTLALAGDCAGALAHYDLALALSDPADRRALATQYSRDPSPVTTLYHRALALWVLGHPEKALADTHHALKGAREIGQVGTLMSALTITSLTPILCGDVATANGLLDELIALADEKGSFHWKAQGLVQQGCVLALTGEAAQAVQTLASGLAAWRSTGATLWTPLFLTYLTRAYADLGQFDDASRSISDAMTVVETTKENLWEADVHRVAGEIALKSPERDEAKAEVHFARAITVAREQQAKSWELRAAMSLTQLRRDQGRLSEAFDLLSGVYGWFTEGFDTLDLKRAKALMDTLAS
jgi:class 3 adenylate cyclase/predicted ATPase